jgi:hypothetical protein
LCDAFLAAMALRRGFILRHKVHLQIGEVRSALSGGKRHTRVPTSSENASTHSGLAHTREGRLDIGGLRGLCLGPSESDSGILVNPDPATVSYRPTGSAYSNVTARRFSKRSNPARIVSVVSSGYAMKEGEVAIDQAPRPCKDGRIVSHEIAWRAGQGGDGSV